jgi:1-acyl-sn-glycerol-3-phosphate acyltransferase
MALNVPVAKWGRLQVSGLETLPESGPLLVVGNHDSHWDPVMVGVAARKRRQIRALAKSTLWDVKGLAPILDGMGQVPIQRGKGDATALAKAIEVLRAGACIGVFPEGTRSRGKVLRAKSGVGRLALEVPEAHVSMVAIEGTSDLTGFPRRPRLRVTFFDPAGGQPRPDEDPGELSARLLSEVRAISPPTISYRKRKATPQ